MSAPSQPQLNGTNLSPEELGNSTLYRGPVDPANWFGIRKGFPNLGYIQVGWGGGRNKDRVFPPSPSPSRARRS